MGLRKTTLAVIGTILVLMIVLLSSIAKIIVLDGYSRLERNTIMENTEQALRMLDDEVAQVKRVVGDWAPWDDTYQFVQDRNQDYIDNNLGDSTIINLPVDFLLYLNAERKTVYCKYVDPETEEDAACPDSIRQFAQNSSIIPRTDDAAETISGLAMLGNVPALIAAGPIMTSQFSGPVRGTLLTGRFLQKNEIKRLANKVRLDLKIESLTGQNLSPEFSRMRDALSKTKRTAVVPLDDKNIAAYSLLFDVGGNPVLMMGITTGRQIFAEGRKSLLYIIISICVTGLVFIFVTILFLETRVLSRIIRLHHDIQDIGSTGDLTRKTTVQGKDELAGLSSAINQMVEAVRLSTERDRAILESMEDGYFELDLEGRITFFNNALARLFDYPEKISGMSITVI